MLSMMVDQQQQQQKRRARSVALQVADKLDKYISLPPRPKFKVNDVLQRGQVYSFIRSKSSFFALPDRISVLKSRLINITSTGFMIIYETDEKGLVVDLRRVLNVFCNADRFVRKSQKENYLRCHIKIRLPRGNVHLFVRDDFVHKWTCAIMRAAAAQPIQKALPSEDVAVETNHDEMMMMTAVESSDEIEEMTMSSPYSALMTTTNCESCMEEEEMATVIENPHQNPTTSVRSLRQKLEKDLRMKPKEQVEAEQQQQLRKTPQFVSELFCPPAEAIFDDATIVLEPTNEAERREQEKEVEREEKWWTRSLRC